MIVPMKERGAALLTTLLLVAVIATIAASALDRLGLATRLAVNAGDANQGRAWLSMAEEIAMARIEDQIAAEPTRTTRAGEWIGVERAVELPDGGTVFVAVRDGGNCFNLASLVERRGERFATRKAGREEFVRFMTLIGIGEGEAIRIAAAASDYQDSDELIQDNGGEDSASPVPNRPMADASELRLVAGVSERHWSLLKPFVCTLPESEMSPINVNTLSSEEAPLVAMMMPKGARVALARSLIASRPASGWESAYEFWQAARLGDAPDEHAKVMTRYYRLDMRVELPSGQTMQQHALVDARRTPARIIWRRWDEMA